MIICRSLESLLYAWRTQQKCVILDPIYINRHDDKYNALDFKDLNCSNAYEYWSNLCFVMSLTGLLICPNNVENIREDDGNLIIATKRSRIIRLKPDKVVWFDQPIKDSFDVYDYFDVRSARPHDICLIESSDDFVRRVNFFSSPRAGANRTKDLVASSRMTHEQLLSADWGNGIVRLKVLRVMASEGITGTLSMKTETKTYYKKPKIDFYKRVVSDRVVPMHVLQEVVNMEQIKGEAWKTAQILKVK